MKISQLKEFVKQVVKEENDYQQLFKHMLDKSGKSITSMSDDEKKKFFNAVDTAYKAKSEGRLRGYNEGVSEGLSKDAIVRTLTRDKNAYYLSKDGNGWILDITPKAAQQSTFHQKFDVKDMGKGHLGMKYKLSELTAGQKKIDVDGDGEIEGSDLAALRAKDEVGTNDWHFKAIMKLYDKAGSFGKKKISAAATASTNASRREIERALRDTDYDEISDISDKIGLKEAFNKMAQKKK
jgi:hypothetical protein